ncbi:MAG: dihydropteroate synthase [Pseudomonadales bacterium]
MGVLNITPDSFSDGGLLYQSGGLRLNRVLQLASDMVEQGAAILDVGGESTRPGATQVSEQEELDRVLPVIEAIAARLDVIVSVDTSTAGVIRAATAVGAGLINDVRALTRVGALDAAAASGLPVCLMHMQGVPLDMQQAPEYHDVIAEVRDWLQCRADDCMQAGIGHEKIILDPGFGFGKTLQHNLALFNALETMKNLHYPLLVGVSRKTMIGSITGRGISQRMAGSITLAALAAERGASILRVHDVAETVDALKIVAALKENDQ